MYISLSLSLFTIYVSLSVYMCLYIYVCGSLALYIYRYMCVYVCILRRAVRSLPCRPGRRLPLLGARRVGCGNNTPLLYSRTAATLLPSYCLPTVVLIFTTAFLLSYCSLLLPSYCLYCWHTALYCSVLYVTYDMTFH
jgi:hypothetical protein